MGIGPEAVLEPNLRMKGTQGLRVVDLSARPDIVSAHINGCVLMMVMTASVMILGKLPLPRAINV
jgi:choline dehydrogenase-like flavoprotein